MRYRSLPLLWASLLCLVVATHVAAEEDKLTTTFSIDDADPEAHVPDARAALAAPLQMGYWVMLVAERAEAATKRGDGAAAVRYYRAIAKAVPDRAVGFTRACATYEALGDLENATRFCRDALDKEGATRRDYANYVRVALADPGKPSPQTLDALDTALAHLETELTHTEPSVDTKLIVPQLRCQIGLRVSDPNRLKACTETLHALAPREPTTLTFRFAHALMTQRFDVAEDILEIAPAAGMTESGVAMMRQRLDAERGPMPTWVLPSAALGGVALALALLLRMRRRPSVMAHG